MIWRARYVLQFGSAKLKKWDRKRSVKHADCIHFFVVLYFLEHDFPPECWFRF